MRIFAIRDGNADVPKDLAYLFYYEKDKTFYIELPEGADEWETPLLLSSFVKRGETTVNPYWSKLWVQQRIIPTDRQNLGQVLRDNGLELYDEFDLLVLADGRCAQDEYYLTERKETELPAEIRERIAHRVEDVVPLPQYHLLVFFSGGAIQKVDALSFRLPLCYGTPRCSKPSRSRPAATAFAGELPWSSQKKTFSSPGHRSR